MSTCYLFSTKCTFSLFYSLLWLFYASIRSDLITCCSPQTRISNPPRVFLRNPGCDVTDPRRKTLCCRTGPGGHRVEIFTPKWLTRGDVLQNREAASFVSGTLILTAIKHFRFSLSGSEKAEEANSWGVLCANPELHQPTPSPAAP